MISLMFGNTSDWIGVGVLLIFVLLALLAVSKLSRPYEVTVEEFEKRAKEAPSLLSAGVVGLQKILEPGVAKAVAAQQELRQGRFDGEQGSGEPPEPGMNQESEGRRQ